MSRIQALISIIAFTFCLSTSASPALTEDYSEELRIPMYPNSKSCTVPVYLFGSETPMRSPFKRFIDINKQNFLYTIISFVKANFLLENFDGLVNISIFFHKQCCLNVYLLDLGLFLNELCQFQFNCGLSLPSWGYEVNWRNWAADRWGLGGEAFD